MDPENQENGGGMDGTADVVLGMDTTADVVPAMNTGADVVPGMKRPAEGLPGGPAGARNKKKRKTANAGPILPKNALMQLNEIRPGLIYNMIDQGGPVHNPSFTVAVEVNGQLFQGVAPSKKKAKLDAAEKALASFVQLPNSAARAQALGIPKSGDFTGDEEVDNLGKGDNGSMTHQGIPLTKAPVVQPPGKNPVMILNEIRPGTQYVALSDVESYSKTKVFIMEVTIDGKTFNGQGRNKKMAKARAAQAALKDIFNLDFKVPEGSEPVHAQGSSTELNVADVPPIADRVATLIMKQFSELTSGFSSQYARRKVLAGIVMTTNKDLESAKVVSVTTGTKCVNGEYMSVSGLVLNDCHAEILARRCLRRFLFEQLQLLADDCHTQHSIFEANCDTNVGGYKLKDGVEFHLYISTSPCGDARIFSPHETSMKEPDKHPRRKARGQLRTKIESGEGTIPITAGKLQTWDGIVQGGERLLTMSCSDKLARWNAIGCQGALLGQYIEPVYLSSIILGSFYHSQHMARAICTRSGNPQNLPLQYKVATPLLSGISNSEHRQPGKCPSFAIAWLIGNDTMEVITTMRGKTEQEKPSQLCKFEMFKLFNNLYGKLTPRADVTMVDPSVEQYCDVKASLLDYQQAKMVFTDTFRAAEMGYWVNKPREQDEFTISDGISAMESMIAAMQQSIEQMKKGGNAAKASVATIHEAGHVAMALGGVGDVATATVGVGDASFTGVANMFQEKTMQSTYS